MAQSYYLISEELATSIYGALQAKYSQTSQPFPELSAINGLSIPSLISAIEGSGQQGDTVSPISVNGNTLNAVWMGTKTEYNNLSSGSKLSTTLYIITG